MRWTVDAINPLKQTDVEIVVHLPDTKLMADRRHGKSRQGQSHPRYLRRGSGRRIARRQTGRASLSVERTGKRVQCVHVVRSPALDSVPSDSDTARRPRTRRSSTPTGRPWATIGDARRLRRRRGPARRALAVRLRVRQAIRPRLASHVLVNVDCPNPCRPRPTVGRTTRASALTVLK